MRLAYVFMTLPLFLRTGNRCTTVIVSLFPVDQDFGLNAQIFKTSQISQCGASDTIIQSQKLMYKVMDSHNPRAPKAPSGVMSEQRR